MLNRTPLYSQHVAANAKLVDFAGFEMPLHYGSQLKEHHQVRNDAGMFDVSHMGVCDVQGKEASHFLLKAVANNIGKLIPGKALYTCLLNEAGGVIDDLIVYKINDDFYRLVINASRREKDMQWLQTLAASFQVEIVLRIDLAILALQGPMVKNKISHLLAQGDSQAVSALKPFHFLMNDAMQIAATGYTGEMGFEVILSAADAPLFWQKAVDVGILPCGLGARDTLRLEGGLNLYGLDMDETVTPLESNLAWTVAFLPAERDFVGRSVLEKQKNTGVLRRLVGLILKGPGIIRNHQTINIYDQSGAKMGEGEVTSGGYSPTLEKSIAFARLPAELVDPTNQRFAYFVDIRNKQIPVELVSLPFYARNKVEGA